MSITLVVACRMIDVLSNFAGYITIHAPTSRDGLVTAWFSGPKARTVASCCVREVSPITEVLS
jgi:hypothetical protein